MRVAFRLALRDIVSHRGRALLMVAMVMLPMMVLSAVDVLYRSKDPTPAQSVDRQLGAASAYVWAPVGADRLDQAALDQAWPGSFLTSLPPDRRPAGMQVYPGQAAIDLARTILRPAPEVAALLPPDNVLTAWSRGDIAVARPGDPPRAARAEILDLRSPVAGGRYRITTGVAPSATGQVVFTEHLADLIGVQVGDQVLAGSPMIPTRVVGLAATETAGDRDALITLPGTLTVQPDHEGPRYLISSPTGLDADAVHRLQRNGIQAYARAAALSVAPTGPADPPEFTIAIGVVLVVLGLSQAVLLTGPAFGIAARRMRRQLGLAAATGASPLQLATVVLAGGVLLGVGGSALGVLVGTLTGVALRSTAARLTDGQFQFLNLEFADLLLILGIGVVTTLAAACWPARQVLREDPLAALARRSRPPRRPGLVSLAGAAVGAAAIGVIVLSAVTAIGTGLTPEQVAERGQNATVRIAISLVVLQIGLLLAVPQWLGLLSRVGRWLPTSARLALRSSARNRGRGIATVATVMVVSTGAAVVTTILATTQAQDEAAVARYQPPARFEIRLAYDPTGNSSAFGGDLRTTLAGDLAQLAPGSVMGIMAELAGPHTDSEMLALIPPANACPWYQPGGAGITVRIEDIPESAPDAAQLAAAQVDPRCAAMRFSTLTADQGRVASRDQLFIGDATTRLAITGVADPQADAALAAGKAIVFDPRYFAGGRLTMQSSSYAIDGRSIRGPVRSVPAVRATWATGTPIALLPPGAVAAVGGAAAPERLVVDLHRDPVTADFDAIRARCLATGSQCEVNYWSPEPLDLIYLLMLAAAAVLILGVILVVTALGVVDSDDDSAVLAAVGASPASRRWQAGWSALTGSLSGGLLGVAAGLLGAWSLYALQNRLNGQQISLVVPWPELGTFMITTPVLGFLLAVLFTRSRIDMLRRSG